MNDNKPKVGDTIRIRTLVHSWDKGFREIIDEGLVQRVNKKTATVLFNDGGRLYVKFQDIIQ